MKRDLQGIMLRHESTTLWVLHEKHAFLILAFFFIWPWQRQEKKEPPHARDAHPDKNNQRQKAEEPTHNYCPCGFWR